MMDSKVTVLGHEDHPICPVLFGDSAKTLSIAEQLVKLGLFVVPFSYPVVPKDSARIRIQLSAVHEPDQVKYLVESLNHIA